MSNADAKRIAWSLLRRKAVVARLRRIYRNSATENDLQLALELHKDGWINDSELEKLLRRWLEQP